MLITLYSTSIFTRGNIKTITNS